MSEINSFYTIGHLDPWFRVQNAITLLTLLLMFFAVLSAWITLRRPLRWITRLKFLLVTVSFVFLGWFLVFFHFIGSATHY